MHIKTKMLNFQQTMAVRLNLHVVALQVYKKFNVAKSTICVESFIIVSKSIHTKPHFAPICHSTDIKVSSNYPSVLIKYSTSDINTAYHKLVSEITDIIETKNFKKMRRAYYAEIRAVDSTLPESLIEKLQCTKSADEMLALSPYWNWFDTRLLQAVVSASGSSEAEVMLEQFKQIHYTRRVNEILPYVSIVPLKDSIVFTEKFDKDPHEITLLDIIRHKHILEYEVLDIGERKLILSCVKSGCVELSWQVPSELVYIAYTSMKHKCDKLSSLGIKSLVCVEADESVGLPFLWCGQKVDKVGPIEPLPEYVRLEPYSLPQGFQWVTLGDSDVKMILELKGMKSFTPGQVYVAFSHPTAKRDWRFGSRTIKGKLVAVVLAAPVCLSIQGVPLRFVNPRLTFLSEYSNKRMQYILLKELARRINLCGINQMILAGNRLILKPVVTHMIWEHQFTFSTSHQLPNSPTTPGWRKITPEVVPSALALVNKYLSQFEVCRVFTTVDFGHCFLRPAASHSFVHTYVVENKSNDITDLISTLIAPSAGTLNAIVASTQSPEKQIIMDIMVCAREIGVSKISIGQCKISSKILSSLLFKPTVASAYQFYNYKYPEITEDKFWFIDI